MDKSADVNNDWNIGGVSIAGFSHVAGNIPCQDAHTFNLNSQGYIIGAVADGAGSAKFSDRGARLFVDKTVSHLSEIEGDNLKNVEFIKGRVIEAINEAKEQLINPDPEKKSSTASNAQETDFYSVNWSEPWSPWDKTGEAKQQPTTPILEPAENSIKDFAATLVVVFANSEGGTFFHVGDGAGVAFESTKLKNFTVSRPHNGQYSNETFFVTMENWEQYLRVTPFKHNFDTILLMSDGVTPMAMSKGCKAFIEGFINPMIRFLKNSDLVRAKKGLTDTLSSDGVRSITGDDKTLFWAISKEP